MNTEEQVSRAASRYRRWKSGDVPNPYRYPYFNFDGMDLAYINLDRATLADAYIDELARREADQAERAKPIDAEWCLANGALRGNQNGEVMWSFGSVNVYWQESWGVTIEGDPYDRLFLREITTRGQLLDLIAALNGGAT